jgi:hypothetical protein
MIYTRKVDRIPKYAKKLQGVGYLAAFVEARKTHTTRPCALGPMADLMRGHDE